MKVVCIIQARLKSTRLPGKVLLPLPSGRTVLEEVIFRCREARHVHQVCVAIPNTKECDILLPFTGGATVVRGSELDVLDRYRRAAEITGADLIVRVTSDCPLIPSDLIDQVIDQRNVHALPYACNVLPETWPQGYACEVFTDRLLRRHAEECWREQDREHVTWSMRESARGNPRANVACPDGDRSHLRWTLDTIEDYITIVELMEAAKNAADLYGVARHGR